MGIVKHGHAARGAMTEIYMIWLTMRKRCSNPKSNGYARYGGRGISVCQRWDEFNNFIADMGERLPGKTLDRKDNDGNYEPSNCRWATRKEQSANSTLTKQIVFNGETKSVRQWEVSLGLGQGALWHRLKNGWSLSKALSTKKASP